MCVCVGGGRILLFTFVFTCNIIIYTFRFSEESVTKMDIQQTTVKTDMQSDENSGEEGDARANLGGDQKVIGFLTEWVSAYNFIKGMVLLRQTLFSNTSIRNCCMECAYLLLYPYLSLLLACP